MAQHNGPVSNAFIVNDLRILSRTARYLGKTEDADRYEAQLEKTREAYLRTFINEDGTMKDDYQGAYIMALHFVVPKGPLWTACSDTCRKDPQGGHADRILLNRASSPLLADNGEADFAYELLLQEECPGWMYQVLRGATTTWERWDAILPDGSVNEADQNGNNMVSLTTMLLAA